MLMHTLVFKLHVLVAAAELGIVPPAGWNLGLLVVAASAHCSGFLPGVALQGNMD
jgi:hypothetical protein